MISVSLLHPQNSVRHCLSLGQCFHKVMHPGALPYKKGFNWRVVPEKVGVVHQEIIKYLTMTGKTAESFGISRSSLVAGEIGSLIIEQSNNFVLSLNKHTELPTPPMMPTVLKLSQQSTSRTTREQLRQSNVTMCTVSPSLGFVELQLSPKDLELLKNMGQSVTPSLSPYDYNLLTNPSMKQELNTIVQLIKEDNTSESTSERLSSVSEQRNIQIEKSSSCTRIIVSTSKSISEQFDSIMTTPSPTVSCSETASTSSRACSSPSTVSEANIFVFPPTPDTTNSSKTSTLISEPSKQADGNTKEPAECTDSVCYKQNNIEYSQHSPPGFIVEYPSTIDLVQEDAYTEAEVDNTSYPFISPELENLNVSLNELNNSSDWEYSEEPIVARRKVEQCLAIEPVEGDWNCWREPSYLDRINTLASSLTTQVSSVLGESLDSTDCSIEHIRDSYKKQTESTQYSQRNVISTGSKRRPNSLHNLKSLIVSIPFVRLMTSRQAKKYCRK